MVADMLRFFRLEARELIDAISQGLAALGEAGTAELRGVLEQLMRQAHTLKGAARVVKELATADGAHALEGLLVPHRDAGTRPPADVLAAAFKLTDAMDERLRVLESGPAPAAATQAAQPAAAPPVEEVFSTVRIELASLGELLETCAEARGHVDALAQGLTELAERVPEAAALMGSLDRARRELTDLQNQAHRLRLVPASAIFPLLERAVRDAAGATGKQVAFEATGGETRLDGHVLGGLRDALLHIVRNAVDHGLEPPAERAALGKPAVGRIKLDVERLGDRVRFSCADDGKGIDRSALRQALGRHGHAAAEGDEALIQQVFEAGISTRETVSELSGRGVGLDVARHAAEGLKGTAHVDSTPGAGTRFELSVPVSLSAMRALYATLGDMQVALPLEAVARAHRLAPGELATTSEGQAMLHEGSLVPFIGLDRVFEGIGPLDEACTAVVLNAGAHRAALGVTGLAGTADVVVRRLPAQVGQLPLVLGAAFDAAGRPVPVLDPHGLVAAARSAPPPVRAAKPASPVVLVIDDSLTTRMLEQSILTSAGYEVELAASGEEGLALAASGRFALIVCDVEMPGIDGFEVMTRLRANPATRDIPAVLMTSRAAPEDRRRGLAVGARAYLVKGEFEQGTFLTTVRGLVG